MKKEGDIYYSIIEVTFKFSCFYCGQGVWDFPKSSAEQQSIILPSVLLCQLYTQTCSLIAETVPASMEQWLSTLTTGSERGYSIYLFATALWCFRISCPPVALSWSNLVSIQTVVFLCHHSLSILTSSRGNAFLLNRRNQSKPFLQTYHLCIGL